MSQPDADQSASVSSPPVSSPPQAESPGTETDEELAYANRPFRGWRLLGVIGLVVLVLAIVSATVDWVVIGPLEGRAF